MQPRPQSNWVFFFLSTVRREISARGEIFNFNRSSKNWCHTWVSTRGETNIFLLHVTSGWNYIFKDLQRILQNVLRKKHSSYMQLQDYIKTMMLNFINKRRKIFNFKTFKIVLSATINSAIVTASLLFIKLVYSTTTKNLWYN